MLPKGLQNAPQSITFIDFSTRIRKQKTVFGLRKRKRIEVHSNLETAKKQPTHDMQTNTHTHVRFEWKNAGKALERE